MDGDLVHTVIISLKKDLSSNQKEFVVSLLASLENIPETKGLLVAEKANTNDSRAKKDYDIILQMAFNNEEDLAIYSTDKYHLSIRDQLKQFLSGPPVVYDYRVK